MAALLAGAALALVAYNISNSNAADTEVEALKEEVAKIKMKENQTTDMAAEVETLMEEVTKLKTKDNQTTEMETEVESLTEEVAKLKALLCPTPWTLLSTGCYLFDTMPRNWTEASQFCKGLFSKMVEVETKEENDALYEEMNINGWKSQKLEAWIGLTDLKQEGTFIWSSTGEEPGYTNWQAGAPGEPDNGGGKQDCAYIRWHSGKWDDYQCDIRAGEDWKLVAVCEKI